MISRRGEILLIGGVSGPAEAVFEAESRRSREAAADLFVGEGGLWGEVLWQRIDGAPRFGEAFGEDPDLGFGGEGNGHGAFEHPGHNVVEPDRGGEDEGAAVCDAGDSSGDFAEVHLFRAGDGYGGF